MQISSIDFSGVSKPPMSRHGSGSGSWVEEIRPESNPSESECVLLHAADGGSSSKSSLAALGSDIEAEQGSSCLACSEGSENTESS